MNKIDDEEEKKNVNDSTNVETELDKKLKNKKWDPKKGFKVMKKEEMKKKNKEDDKNEKKDLKDK